MHLTRRQISLPWNDLSPWRFRALTGVLVLSTLGVTVWAAARTMQASHEAAVLEAQRSAVAEAERRQPGILAEIVSLGPDHPWAGRYDSGSSTAHLVLAPRSGFVITFSGCFPTWDASYGSVR